MAVCFQSQFVRKSFRKCSTKKHRKNGSETLFFAENAEKIAKSRSREMAPSKSPSAGSQVSPNDSALGNSSDASIERGSEVTVSGSKNSAQSPEVRGKNWRKKSKETSVKMRDSSSLKNFRTTPSTTPLSLIKVSPIGYLMSAHTSNKVASSFMPTMPNQGANFANNINSNNAAELAAAAARLSLEPASQQMDQKMAARRANWSAPLPVSSRKVRDSGSLLCMLAFLGFLFYVIWDSVFVKRADLSLIVHGHDSYGNICGRANKPIEFVEKSGQNYTDRPYTKYTLINAHFERFTLDSSRLKMGELVYVRDTSGGGSVTAGGEPNGSASSGGAEFEFGQMRRQEAARRQSLTAAPVASEMQQARRQSNESSSRLDHRPQQARSEQTEPADDLLDQVNRAKQSGNATLLKRIKSNLMYQYPPMHGYKSELDAVQERSAPRGSPPASSGGTVVHFVQPASSASGQNAASSAAGQSAANTAAQWTTPSSSSDHVLVRPINTNQPETRSAAEPQWWALGGGPPAQSPGSTEVLSSSDQLLYLTECVASCPKEHVELVFYRCLPNNWRFSLFPQAINVTRTFIDELLTDLSHCYKELIYTFSLALVLSLGLLVLLRFLASFIIWTCILLLVALFLSMASYSWLNYYNKILELNNMFQNEHTYLQKLATSDKWLIGSIFLTFVTIAIIGLIIVMRKRIKLVTMLFKESGKAIADMPLLLLQPLFTFATLFAVILAFSLGLICLQSMKQPLVDFGTGFVVYKAELLYKVMKWYHVFAFLWVSHFVIACQHYVIGSAVSKWYFSSNRYHELGSPIGASISELILYYLGSVALGSFLAAIFKVLRLIMRQIQFLIQRNCINLGHSNDSSSGSHNQSSHFGYNPMQPLDSAAAHLQPAGATGGSCCASLSYVWRLSLWFIDNIVLIINRDAYVEIAIHGDSFLSGAKRAFRVISSNPLRLMAIKSVGNLLLIIAKVCVVFGTITVAYILIEEKKHSLNYSWSPLIISAAYAYVVAHWFLSVYEMVIDALFICYCEDFEMNKLNQQMELARQSNFMTQILTNSQLAT